MSVRKMGEWIVRTLAIAALFLAFKPGDAMAAVSMDDTDSIQNSTDEVTVGAVVDIDVDDEGEAPPLSE